MYFYESFFSKLCFCLWAVILRFRNQLRYRLSWKVAYGSAKAWGFYKEALVSRGCKALLALPWSQSDCRSSGLVSWLRVRLIRCNIKSVLSQFIFCQIAGQRLYICISVYLYRYTVSIWLLKETKTEFVLLIEPMGSSKRKSRSETNCPLPTGWDLKQLPNCHRKERDFIWCKMHELVSKNKIGSPLVATNFIPGKWVIWVSDIVLWDLEIKMIFW